MRVCRTQSDSFETPCHFITGVAGSGKSFSARQESEQDPSSALLTATTGIAAVNLDSVTFWSALGIRPDSVEEQFSCGEMTNSFRRIATNHRALLIDEASMLPASMLDMLCQSADRFNKFTDLGRGIALTLVGDFCQLPPVNAPWCFESANWPRFEAQTIRLTKNHRQRSGPFLDALNELRAGRGSSAARLLTSVVSWQRIPDAEFEGTVILARNNQVDQYNWSRFTKIQGKVVKYPARRWGNRQRIEWRNIPETLQLKDKLYVMVLANDTERDVDDRPQFRWVNGDCGHVVDCAPHAVQIKLNRTGEVHWIGPVTREVLSKAAPTGHSDNEYKFARETGRPLADGSFWDQKRQKWVVSAITYMPLRLVYATTVHKSQGLTLTGPVTVDLREPFFGQPAMVYVALSRCSNAENLHLVGNVELLSHRCRIDERVRRWL